MGPSELLEISSPKKLRERGWSEPEIDDFREASGAMLDPGRDPGGKSPPGSPRKETRAAP